MILSAQTLRKMRPVTPFCEREVVRGRSYGLSSSGYDVRVDFSGLNMGNTIRMSQPVWEVLPSQYGASIRITPNTGLNFMLAATIEHFVMPNNVVARVHDKSTWIRQGLQVGNTFIEAGWRGFLTLELIYHGNDDLIICQGDPIAHIVFEYLDQSSDQPYNGKYQDQEAGAQEARFE